MLRTCMCGSMAAQVPGSMLPMCTAALCSLSGWRHQLAATATVATTACSPSAAASAAELSASSSPHPESVSRQQQASSSVSRFAWLLQAGFTAPLQHAPAVRPTSWRRAGLHQAALAEFALPSSDEDTGSGSTSTQPRRQQQHQHQYQQQQQQQQHALPSSKPSWAAAQPAPQAHRRSGSSGAAATASAAAAAAPTASQVRYQGHLHAPHGRRHATTNVERFISEQLLACKSLGMLRRIMIKNKALFEPSHVADTLLCLQHLVRAARAMRRAGAAANGGGGGGAAPVRAGQPPLQHYATSQARAQPRVRAAGELASSKLRSAESDGHMEQLLAQMLGELGAMTWHQMGDMSGPDLAKTLYSWGVLEAHPEPVLLADVKASFLSAATAASASAPQQPAQAQQTAQWVAAGLWGLARLAEPFQRPVLALLQQHWRSLLALWTPQQLADIAGALALAADEQVAAGALGGTPQGEQQAADVLAGQLMPLVASLSEQLVSVLHAQQLQAERGVSVAAAAPWPESLLLQDFGGSAGRGAVREQADGAMAQLAWRMLQALSAVGVNLSEPEDEGLGAAIAALAAATKVPPQA